MGWLVARTARHVHLFDLIPQILTIPLIPLDQTATDILTDDTFALITDVATLIFDVSQLNTDLLSFQGAVTAATTGGVGGVVGAATSVSQDDITTLTGDVNAVTASITALQGVITLLGSLINVPQVGEAEIGVIQTGVVTAVGPLVSFATQVINGSAASGLDATALQTAVDGLQTSISSLGTVTVQISPTNIAPVSLGAASTPTS